MPRFTVPFIRGLRPDPAGKELVHFDGRIPGFGVRVKPSGAMTYFLQYRPKGGKTHHKVRIGAVETPDRRDGLTPKQALVKARAARTGVDNGKDPAAEIAGNRNAKTVSELCDEYLKAPKDKKAKKASTLALDSVRIETHIKPQLGRKAVISLTAADIEKFQAKIAERKAATDNGGVVRIRGGRGAAIRTIETLSAILAWAVKTKIIPENPAYKVKWRANKPVKPPFSFAAVSRVGAAMRELAAEGEAAVGVRAIRLLLLTGFRRNEALTLKWGYVDTEAHCARLPDTKTGAQTRLLGKAALDHLASFQPDKAKPNDFVFPGPGKKGHYIAVRKAWKRVAKRAKISGVTVHGLRHWFASGAAEMNYSELVIAGLLGHSAGTVTGRYATTPDSALISAADAISARLADALDA